MTYFFFIYSISFNMSSAVVEQAQITYMNYILKEYLNNPDNNYRIDIAKTFNYIVAIETNTIYDDNTCYGLPSGYHYRLSHSASNRFYSRIKYIKHYNDSNRLIYVINLPETYSYNEKTKQHTTKDDIVNKYAIDLTAFGALNKNDNINISVYIYYEDDKLYNSWVKDVYEIASISPEVFHYISTSAVENYGKNIIAKLVNDNINKDKSLFMCDICSPNVVHIMDFDNMNTIRTFQYYLKRGIESNSLKELMRNYVKDKFKDIEIENKVNIMFSYVMNVYKSSRHVDIQIWDKNKYSIKDSDNNLYNNFKKCEFIKLDINDDTNYYHSNIKFYNVYSEGVINGMLYMISENEVNKHVPIKSLEQKKNNKTEL